MKSLTLELFALLGIVSIIYGVYLIYIPVAYIFFGIACLWLCAVHASRTTTGRPPT